MIVYMHKHFVFEYITRTIQYAQIHRWQFAG